jgi:predicted small lipoprotein YifL
MRTAIIAIVLIAIVGLLAGCGSPVPEPPKTKTAAPAAPAPAPVAPVTYRLVYRHPDMSPSVMDDGLTRTECELAKQNFVRSTDARLADETYRLTKCERE